MEMANILLKNLRDIKTTQVHKKPTPPSISSSSSSVSTLPQYQPPSQERLVPQHQPQPQPPPQAQFQPQPQVSARTPPGTYGMANPRDPRFPGASPSPQVTQIQSQIPPGAYDPMRALPAPGGRPMPMPPAASPAPPPPSHRLSYEQSRPQDPYSAVRALNLSFDATS
jgi:hypothetical protein